MRMLAYLICQGSDLQNLLKYGASVKLKVGGGADATGRNSGKSFRFQKAQLTGVVTLARAWHCIGGTVRRRHAWAIHLLTTSTAQTACGLKELHRYSFSLCLRF